MGKKAGTDGEEVEAMIERKAKENKKEERKS